MDEDPAYHIAVARVSEDAPECEVSLRAAIDCTLRRHGTTAARIGVALVDDAHIAHLNVRHLDHKGPTDVITFDLRDDPSRTSDDNVTRAVKGQGAPVARALEGEIVVSVDTARREADTRGHPVEAELALYTVHGVLHLLGYDDTDENDARRMHDTEDEILSEIGWGPIFRGRPQ
jgi:probable rRNA maturation factor